MPGRVIVSRKPPIDDVHQWIAERTRDGDGLADRIEERTRSEVDRLILDWIRKTDRRDPGASR